MPAEDRADARSASKETDVAAVADFDAAVRALLVAEMHLDELAAIADSSESVERTRTLVRQATALLRHTG